MKIYFQTKHEAATLPCIHITGRRGSHKPMDDHGTDVKLDMTHHIIIIIIIMYMAF